MCSAEVAVVADEQAPYLADCSLDLHLGGAGHRADSEQSRSVCERFRKCLQRAEEILLTAAQAAGISSAILNIGAASTNELAASGAIESDLDRRVASARRC